MSTDLNAQVARILEWETHPRGDDKAPWHRPGRDGQRYRCPRYSTAPPDSDEAARLGWEMIAWMDEHVHSWRIYRERGETMILWRRTQGHMSDSVADYKLPSPWKGFDTLLAALARAVVATAPTDAENAPVQEDEDGHAV